MHVETPHPWDLSPREAMALQRELAARVVRRGSPRSRDVRLIAGCDVAFDKPHGRGAGAIAVLAYPSLEEVERVTAEAPVTFPYVPGLLSFRETPVLLSAFERLRCDPDMIMVDGHGYAHPRRFGFACHVGLLLERPAIGVAKSRLIGSHAPVGIDRGARADLVDAGETIGALLRTRAGVRPVYVSTGHRIALAAAERWVLDCARGYRLPEPARIADALSRVAKRRMLDATLDMIIEQRAGEPGRWEYVPEDGEVVFRHELDPMPLHYGCSTDIINPADNELLDVMLIDARAPERGERRSARVVDVLLRADGDHKLLAVPVDVEPFSRMTQRRIAAARKSAWAWYVALGKPVTAWGGEDEALAIIERCRAGGERISK